MADNSGQAAPPIAPPLLIGICILGAVITVIVTAALYKLCRRATAEVDQVSAEKPWNPNQRSVEQSQYMEEVRLRNKMYAWERAKAGRGDGHGQKWVETQHKVSDQQKPYLLPLRNDIPPVHGDRSISRVGLMDV